MWNVVCCDTFPANTVLSSSVQKLLQFHPMTDGYWTHTNLLVHRLAHSDEANKDAFTLMGLYSYGTFPKAVV
jgi:hypothetical protein